MNVVSSRSDMLNYLKFVINYLFFYVGWAYCMYQASLGHPFQSFIVVVPILIFHLITVNSPLAELFIIISISMVCTLFDSLMLIFGFIHYSAGISSFPWMAPPWLTAIWMLFAMCLNHSLSWLRSIPFFAAIMGSAAVVICYIGANKVGVIYFPGRENISALLLIAIFWMLFFPFSLKYSNWIKHKINR